MGIDAPLYTYQTPSKSPNLEESQHLKQFWHGPETGERKEEAHGLSISLSLALHFPSTVYSLARLSKAPAFSKRVRKMSRLGGKIHDLPITEHVRRLAGDGPNNLLSIRIAMKCVVSDSPHGLAISTQKIMIWWSQTSIRLSTPDWGAVVSGLRGRGNRTSASCGKKR